MEFGALDLDGPIRRVAIVGVGGAGKSTLAPRLAGALDLPVIHLDREFWRAGWQMPEHDDWVTRHAELVEPERWVIDGNYGNTMRERLARADLVIQMVVPTRGAVARAIRRWRQHRGHARPDMHDECPERFDLAFYRYLLGYRRRRQPVVTAWCTELAPGRTVVIRSSADADALLAQLAALR